MAEKITKSGKKAVIETGGRQYLVSVGDNLEVNLLPAGKSVNFDALMVIDEGKTVVGKPLIEGVKVSADITEQVVKADKVTAIRYKAKKRVRKVRGHRQRLTQIKITKIGSGG
jgi:large subunit ribosomal protein L21